MSDIEKKLTPMGKAMAKRMTKSWEAPQFTLETEVDCEALTAYRKRLPYKASYTTILAKEVADTLVGYPALRSSWAEDHIVEHGDINLGIAVDTKRGLLVPVIFDAAGKTLEQVHADMEDIKAASVQGIYPMEKMQGGVFTISNLGIFNITSFKAIVSAPESAILSVSKMVEKPVIKDGRIVAGKTMKLCISIDHRVADGATGARFMTELAQKLENLGK